MALNADHKQLIQPLLNEGTEILKIIVSSINTAKKKLENSQKK
jgi:hypothetical protein